MCFFLAVVSVAGDVTCRRVFVVQKNPVDDELVTHLYKRSLRERYSAATEMRSMEGRRFPCTYPGGYSICHKINVYMKIVHFHVVNMKIVISSIFFSFLYNR